ncbi:MAG: hypothetical protein J5548_13205 [Prevotella sp.]|nr:hypothetical protein [Prevotella sp.]
MRQRVVIVGIGYTSRIGIIRAVAQIGCEVVVVALENASKRPVDTYSKYIDDTIRFPQRNGGEALVQMLLKRCVGGDGKAILIPNCDFAVATIDRHHDLLNPHFHIPNIGHRQGALVEWMNKERQKALACHLGIDVVPSTNIKIQEGSYELPTGIRYPCFTKTRAYTPGYKSTLHRCDNEQELCQALGRIAESLPNLTIMCEDYKEIDTEYAIVGFSDGNEVVIPGVIEMLKMTEGSDKGVAMQGSIGPVGALQPFIEKLSCFVREVGLVGLFDIDFFLSGGKYYFDELNLRIGGSATAIQQMGVNLPGMLVKTLRGEDTDGMKKKINSTSIFANERTCTEHWSDGFTPTSEYLRLLNTADIRFLDNDDDPEPSKVFHRRQRMMLLRRNIKQLLSWIRL